MAVNEAKKIAFGIGIRWSDNTAGLKSLLRSMSKEIDTKKLELDRPNTELKLKTLQKRLQVLTTILENWLMVKFKSYVLFK